MLICTSIKQLQRALDSFRLAHKTIALVPTMGNLHDGHLQLVRTAHKHADAVLVSLFINPTQFGENEDLDNYPRTLSEDTRKLDELNTDILFTPTIDDIYPLGGNNTTHVHVPKITDILCGASRPGHFDGVTTVVTKLFNMTRADVAIFGEKDFQQLAVIRQMVEDLNIPIKIIGEPIVRETNGLAMSSRNGYLSSEERSTGAQLFQVISSIKDNILGGEKDFSTLEKNAKAILTESGFKPDYITILNRITLAPPSASDEKLIVVAAASLGTTRLIDNVSIDCA